MQFSPLPLSPVNLSSLPRAYQVVLPPLIRATFVLIDHVAGRKPIHRGVEY